MLFLVALYLAFGLYHAVPGTLHAVRHQAGRSSPRLLATAGVLTVVVATVAWPAIWAHNWRRSRRAARRRRQLTPQR